MNKVKALLASVGSVMVLALASVAPAAADAAASNDCSNTGSGSAGCAASATDNSITLSVSGNCSGIFQLSSAQVNALLGQVNGQAGSGNNVGSGSSTSSNSQSSSQGNSSSFTFSPDCSVTNVAAAPSGGQGAGAPEAAQVQAPKGAVHAGGGAGVAQVSTATSLAGLFGSLSAAGLGLTLRKRQLEL